MKRAQERRRAKRLSVNLKAERISCIKDCSVFIENLSKSGIHMTSAPAKSQELFHPGNEIEIKLKTNNGDMIILQCNVKWSYDNSHEDLTSSVGLEIVDPPEEYLEFVKALN